MQRLKMRGHYGDLYFGASVLIGFFEKVSDTNTFLNFRASSFFVLLHIAD
jgi:hypothetical protein